MRTNSTFRIRPAALALALAALFAGSAQASLDTRPYYAAPDAGPVAELSDTDLLRADADYAGDWLKPGEFEWLPAAQSRTGAPVTILISLNEQRAYVYRDGQRIAVTTVSTGMPGFDTPTGVFEILQKKKVHHSNRYKDNRGRPAAMPFMQRLTWSGIAMHAGRIPGEPASHGCVRLPKQFAQQLYDITRHGGIVVISDDGSTASLARAGVDSQLAPLVGTSTSMQEIADHLVAEEPAGAGIDAARSSFAP